MRFGAAPYSKVRRIKGRKLKQRCELIATTWVAIYYTASRVMRLLFERPVLSGFLYGEVVFLFMYEIVLPLSRVERDPHASLFTVPLIITGWIGHPLLVGMPIALVTRRFGYSDSIAGNGAIASFTTGRQ